MSEQATSFQSAANLALTNVTALREHATKPSNTSTEAEHRRAFVQTFRRWSVLFKRKDGDVEADKWLVAEYYKSLGHLTARQLDLLTDELKKSAIFFPTIAECLTITNPPRHGYSSPFFSLPQGGDAIGSLEWRGYTDNDLITDGRGA